MSQPICSAVSDTPDCAKRDDYRFSAKKHNFEKMFGEIALERQLVDQETIEKILSGAYATPQGSP